MRVVAISSVVVLCAASLATGCANSDHGTDAADGAKQLTVEDLRPLVTMSPDATGWRWDVEPETHVRTPPPPRLDEAEPSYAIQEALADAYTEAGLVQAATSSWWDYGGGKKASSFASLVATPDAATAALEAEYEFAHHWFPEFEHAQIRDIDADDLGEESWAVQGGGVRGGFVEIGWTRGNATLGTYVNCYPCQSDVADAARRWAKTIDDAARIAAN